MAGRVEPVRSVSDIQVMLEYLGARNERDRILALTGFQTGLRISDLLCLRVRDVKGGYLNLHTKKTGRFQRILIGPSLKRELSKFIEGREGHEFLFRSRQGKNKPLSRKRAYSLLRAAAEACHIEHFGTHSLRKTFAYHVYRQSRDVALIQRLLGHSTPDVSLRYIGISQAEEDRAIAGLDFTK